MRQFMSRSAIALVTLSGLAACATAPQPVAEPVVVNLPPMQTCSPMSALTRVVIPEETQTYFAITEIENPPYEPIQSKQKMTRVIEPERVIFVDSEGREVTDICDTQINPDGQANMQGQGGF